VLGVKIAECHGAPFRHPRDGFQHNANTLNHLGLRGKLTGWFGSRSDTNANYLPCRPVD